MMKRDSPITPFKVSNFATPRMIKSFNANGDGGPTAENFQLDLTGRISSRWNKHAAIISHRHFFRSNLYNLDIADPTEIKMHFLTHVKMLIGQFACKKYLDEMDDDKGNVELGDNIMHAH